MVEKIPDNTLTEDLIKGVLSTFVEVIPPEYIHEAQHKAAGKPEKGGKPKKNKDKKKWKS